METPSRGQLVKPHIVIIDQPIKAVEEKIVSAEDLHAQAEAAANCLVRGDYHKVRSTCGDERGRQGLRNGRPPEPRVGVFGGSDIWGLFIAELTGYKLQGSGKERLRQVKQLQNAANILSGGHDGCAANAGFVSVMGILVANPEGAKAYAASQLGQKFDASVADMVLDEAARVSQSPNYKDWNESILGDIYGAEAGEAIEKLLDVPHEAVTFVRDKIDGMWVDQSRLYNGSVAGKGSFVFVDPYSGLIEHIWSSGPDARAKKLQAEHAREMVLYGIALAVPNPVIYQINLENT